MQVCTLLQIGNHASTPPQFFYRLDALLSPNQQRQSTEDWCASETLMNIGEKMLQVFSSV